MRQIGLENLREREEKLRRAGMFMDDLHERDDGIKRSVNGSENYREYHDRADDGRFSTSDDVDGLAKENHRQLNKKNHEDEEGNNKDEGDE